MGEPETARREAINVLPNTDSLADSSAAPAAEFSGGLAVRETSRERTEAEEGSKLRIFILRHFTSQ